MKVLFISNIPSPYRVCFFNELGKYVDLTVTFERKSASDRNNKWSAEESINYTSVFLNGIKVGTDQAFSLRILKQIKKKWDVIVIGGYSTPTGMIAINYLKRNNIPFFIEVDGGFVRKDSAWKYKIKRFLLSSASGWFSSSDATTDYLVHYGAIREKCYLYPFSSVKESELLSVQNQSTDKDIIRKRLGISEKRIVLCVAQIIYRKGIDILIKAAEFLPDDIGIYIVGGEPSEEIKKLSEDAKFSPDRIHFPGFKTKEELSEYYLAADVFSLPTREDIWGLVINEAMSYGLPIITTDRCLAGVALVEPGINGRIVESDNSKQLADAINESLSDEHLDLYGHNSRKLIGEYTIEKMVEAHLKYIC